MIKLEFKDGYIGLNNDNTLTLVGECAHTYYFTYCRECRNTGLNFDETRKNIIASIKELVTMKGQIC
jgi:hypothetical protein